MAAAANPLLDSGRQYLIRVDQAAALLREIGILTADGKLKNDMIRKYNQIDHYVELVAPMCLSRTPATRSCCWTAPAANPTSALS